MGNVIDCVKTRHVLFLQEIYGVALPLCEHRHQNVCAGYFLAVRGLDMNCCALQDALKARRRLRNLAVSRHEITEFVIDVVQNLSAEALELDGTGP